jgi:hypothetical protein
MTDDAAPDATGTTMDIATAIAHALLDDPLIAAAAAATFGHVTETAAILAAEAALAALTAYQVGYLEAQPTRGQRANILNERGFSERSFSAARPRDGATEWPPETRAAADNRRKVKHND